MDTNRTAGDFGAVQNQVVRSRTAARRIGQQTIDVFGAGRGERVVRCGEGVRLFIVLEERKLDDPQDRPAIRGNQLQLLRDVEPKMVENGVDQFGRTKLKEDDVAV